MFALFAARNAGNHCQFQCQVSERPLSGATDPSARLAEIYQDGGHFFFLWETHTRPGKLTVCDIENDHL